MKVSLHERRREAKGAGENTGKVRIREGQEQVRMDHEGACKHSG